MDDISRKLLAKVKERREHFERGSSFVEVRNSKEEKERMEMRVGRRKRQLLTWAAIIVLSLAIMTIAGAYTPWKEWLTDFLEWVESLGALGNIVLIFAFIVISFPFTIGYIPLSLGAGTYKPLLLLSVYTVSLSSLFVLTSCRESRLSVWSSSRDDHLQFREHFRSFSVLYHLSKAVVSVQLLHPADYEQSGFQCALAAANSK